jgi:hypothetical protein
MLCSGNCLCLSCGYQHACLQASVEWTAAADPCADHPCWCAWSQRTADPRARWDAADMTFRALLSWLTPTSGRNGGIPLGATCSYWRAQAATILRTTRKPSSRPPPLPPKLFATGSAALAAGCAEADARVGSAGSAAWNSSSVVWTAAGLAPSCR